MKSVVKKSTERATRAKAQPSSVLEATEPMLFAARQAVRRHAGSAPVSVAPHSRYAGAAMLGLPLTGLLLSSAVERGIGYDKLQILSDALKSTPYEIAETLRISESTLLRRKKDGKLQADESDRLVRLGQIVAKAIQLFEGDQDGARAWLHRPARALGGATPLKYSQTYLGAQEVEDLIERLEEGVFT